MQRIKQYRSDYSATKETTLAELKKTYRGFMKEWHPDKFNNDEKKLAIAEAKSTALIEAYHFLVSISPETKEANLDEYAVTISQSQVADFHHKSMRLEVTFTDGNTYEYFGVNQKLFNKFVNSKSLNNFGKRKIFNSYLYRKIKKAAEVA